jgi:predicted enzyme related to lactoylglutathione lyase
MIRRAAILLVVPLAFLVLVARGESEKDARSAHGRFTGEIKPVIYVSDVEKSAPFYRDALGFDFQGYANRNGEPYYAEMICAGVKFGLHEPVSEGQGAKVGKQQLYFRVEDLPAHRERVAAWNGEPGEIRATAWMDMFTVQDLDGNEIVFAVTDANRHTSNPWRARGESSPGR